jgi:hypothetical protein
VELREKIDSVLEGVLIRAKKQREEIPYSRTDGFPIIVIVIGPNFEVATLPMTWTDEAEKYARMAEVSQVAKKTFATAVVLITDTRWVEGDKISRLLGIPTLKEAGGLEKWQPLYRRAVQQKFKGYLGNMPPEWYSEAIVAIAKGPVVGTITRSAHYEKGDNDRIRWCDGHNLEEFRTDFNLLPDWWC